MASALAPFPLPAPMDTLHMRIPSGGTGNATNSQHNSKQRAKFKLEPMKILEPSNKKLSLPESQRIMYILDELIKQLNILDYMEVITNNDEKVSNLIRGEMSEQEHKVNFDHVFVSMCQNHRTLVDSIKKCDLVGSTDPNVKNKETLEMLLKSSCKDILRVAVKKPNWFQTFKKENSKLKINHPQINELLGLFAEIKEITIERLLITPNEQKEKHEYLKELLIREKANNELIKKLKVEQQLGLADKDKDVGFIVK